MAAKVYLTVEEVAERYRTGVNTVRYWVREGSAIGRLSIRVGRRRLWPLAALEKHDAEMLADGGTAA